MSEIRILNAVKTHYDDDGDLLPEFGSGVDAFSVSIPDGKQFDRYELRKLDGSSLFAGCYITSAPAPRTTGNKTIKVLWNYEIFGKIRYSLKAYARDENDPPQVLRIDLLSPDCVEHAIEAINQGRSFELTISGEPAARSWRIIKEAAEESAQNTSPGQVRPMIAVGDDILLSIAIIAGIVAALSLGALTTISLYAISQGYDVKVKHRFDAAGKDTLVIEVRKRPQG